ncbi:MAG: polysaccharide deacetylase family protein [Leucobacter sp.]
MSAVVIAALTAADLTGLATHGSPAQASWQPPEWPSIGAELVMPGSQMVTSEVDTADTALVKVGLGAELGLVGGRLRNDALPIQARYAYIPGDHPVNERVTEIVRDAIAASGKNYTPEAFPLGTGLQDRGCLAGVMDWAGEEVLADPQTGPVGGSGTAVVCEVTAAFNETIGITMRVVTGDADKVATDTRTTLYANLSDGSVMSDPHPWSDEAADAAWRTVIELIRRDAGGLSTAALEAPDEEQLALTSEALGLAYSTPEGHTTITFPAGLRAPELELLGVDATVDETVLSVAPETLALWQSDELVALNSQLAEPFTGAITWNAGTPVDCDLVPCVAVTYDDGPTEFTPRLLDTLAAHHAPATFFVLGPSVRGHPETAQRIVEEGHELGSHTVHHPDLTTLSAEGARNEVLGGVTAVAEVTGAQVTMYRPPYGAVNDAVINAVGLPAIMWSVDTNDWTKPGEAALVERAVEWVSPGGIVLFHDTHEESVAAAAAVFDGLANRGFTPVTVSQLFDGAVPQGIVRQR